MQPERRFNFISSHIDLIILLLSGCLTLGNTMDLMDEWDKAMRKRKTDETRSSYKSQFRMVMLALNMTIEEFVAFARNKLPFHKKMKTYFEDLPLAPLTRNLRISAVQSFLTFMDIGFDTSVIDADRSRTKQGIFTTEIPSQQRLAEILEKAFIKERAAISLLAFCGLRPLLATHIKVKDIEDCRIINNKVTFTKFPARINVQRDYPGNKAKLEFFVFLIEEGADYIKALLENQEDIRLDANILGVQTKRAVQYWITNAFHRCNFRQKAYVLRSYFDNGLSSLDSYKRAFYMGHTGDLTTRYTLRKQLSPESIDELRDEFKAKVEPRITARKVT